MIHVVTYIDVPPVSMDQAISLLREYRKATDGEVLQEVSRRYHFVSVETWPDEPSYQRHESSDHTTRFRSALKIIHNSPNDQRVHQSFSLGSTPGSVGSFPLYVVTHVDVPPPRREETEGLLKRLAEESRKDAGNILYDVFQQNAPRTNHFTVVAAWTDESAFFSHDAAAHTRQFREALGPMLGAPYDERLYNRLPDEIR